MRLLMIQEDEIEVMLSAAPVLAARVRVTPSTSLWRIRMVMAVSGD